MVYQKVIPQKLNHQKKWTLKDLLAANEIVIKSLKQQDTKQLDDKLYWNEVYMKLVNANFDGANVIPVQRVKEIKFKPK